MSSKPFAIVGVCACLFLTISATASASKIINPVTEKENTPKSALFLTFVERILSTHPTILSAQADIDIAKARVDGSEKPLYNPELEIEAEDAEVSIYTLGITQTIDWHDKRAARYDEAELLLQTAKANMVLVKEQVAGELIAVIFQYLSNRDLNVLAESRVQLIERFFNLIKSRQVAGDIGQSGVDTARLALTEAIIQQAGFSSNLIKALGEFKVITGVNVDLDMPYPSDLPASISNNVGVETFAAQHPFVVVAQSKVEVAKARTRVTSQDRRADPSLGVTAGTEDNETLLALRFSIPIQVRNNFRSDVIASGHAAVREEQQAQNIYRQVLGRIESTKKQYSVMSDAWKLWNQSGKTTLRNHLENLEKLWKSGEISTTQYLVQFQQTLDTQLSGAELKGDIWQAWIDWLIATGTVNKWLTNSK